MTKFIAGLISLIPFISGCSNKKVIERNLKFTTFEIGYTNGWTRGLCFWMDSNKIFFSPQRFDTIKYGLVPDSIIEIIDTVLLKIISDTTIKSKDNGCVDCSILAMQTVVGKDTFTIHQIGNIDKTFWPLLKTLPNFIDNDEHAKMCAELFLETQKIIFPPPLPPISNHRKFLHSNN